jgi:hypothetical protein
MEAEAQLFEIVLALSARRGFTHSLHGRDQQTNEDGNDGNDRLVGAPTTERVHRSDPDWDSLFLRLSPVDRRPGRCYDA